MFRCQVCNKRTEDKTDIPCGENADHEFKPQEIVTLHFRRKDGTLACTERRPSPGVQFIGTRFGVTCIRCRSTFFDTKKPQVDQPEPLINVMPEEPPEEEDLPETEDSDKIENGIGVRVGEPTLEPPNS